MYSFGFNNNIRALEVVNDLKDPESFITEYHGYAALMVPARWAVIVPAVE